MAIAVQDGCSFDCLFDDALLVTTTLSTDNDCLVLSAWIPPAAALSNAAGEALLASLLELNAWACMAGEAAFGLDAEQRIVLSRALRLDSLAPDDYLHVLARLLEQARQTRSLQVMLASGGVFR